MRLDLELLLDLSGTFLLDFLGNMMRIFVFAGVQERIFGI